MTNEKVRTDFAATHHALLFGWLAQAVVRHAGEERGEAVVRRAVRRYGEQRGRRMAQRAQANGDPLTMAIYMAYGEWRVGEGEMIQELVQDPPEMVVHVHRCPWHRAWESQDLMPYGRLYCLDIDEALVRGFNPELRLDVPSALTGGEPYCEFLFYHVDPEGRPAAGVVMPWEYHTGHLFQAVREVIVEELGDVGQAAVDEALAEFTAHHGPEAAQVVTAYLDTDFDSLPG